MDPREVLAGLPDLPEPFDPDAHDPPEPHERAQTPIPNPPLPPPPLPDDDEPPF